MSIKFKIRIVYNCLKKNWIKYNILFTLFLLKHSNTLKKVFIFSWIIGLFLYGIQFTLIFLENEIHEKIILLNQTLLEKNKETNILFENMEQQTRNIENMLLSTKEKVEEDIKYLEKHLNDPAISPLALFCFLSAAVISYFVIINHPECFFPEAYNLYQQKIIQAAKEAIYANCYDVVQTANKMQIEGLLKELKKIQLSYLDKYLVSHDKQIYIKITDLQILIDCIEKYLKK